MAAVKPKASGANLFKLMEWRPIFRATPRYMIRLLLFSIGLSLATATQVAAKEPPVPVRTVAPEFPESMRRDGSSGLVMVNCLIDERGNVTDPKIEKSSNVAFERPALEALLKWKFKPATENGAAISVRVTIPIKFICES